MELEQELASLAAALKFGDLPAATVESARHAILWTLGSMVAGANAQGCERVLDFVTEMAGGGAGNTTIIGGGSAHRVDLAGFANGSYAKALENEDKHWMGNSHAYAVATAVVPAAFAMAEHVGGISGRDLLTAVACGLEVEMRMIDGAPHAIDTPFGSTYMFGNLGSAVAACKVLGFDERQTLDAYGLAYSQTAGNYQAQTEGHRVLGIRMQMGFCVRSGIYAALMAKYGMNGPHKFLTGRAGMYTAFFGECDSEAVLSGLGSVFRADRLGFKAYPCCALNHQALDAVRQVRSQCGGPDNIESVHVHGAPFMWKTTVPIAEKQRPRSYVELPWSLPWVVACILTAERLTLADLQDQALADTARMRLAGRVTAELDAPEDGVYAVVTLKDGRVIESGRIGSPWGHPDNPLSLDDISARYDDVTTYAPPHMEQDDLRAAKDLVLCLEDAPDAAAAVRLLA